MEALNFITFNNKLLLNWKKKVDLLDFNEVKI